MKDLPIRNLQRCPIGFFNPQLNKIVTTRTEFSIHELADTVSWVIKYKRDEAKRSIDRTDKTDSTV